MKKLVAACVGVLFMGLAGCGGTYEEETGTQESPTPPAPEMSTSTSDATELVGFVGPSDPLDGSAAAPAVDDRPVHQMECGKTFYESTNSCRAGCYRVDTCSDGRPMYKCNSVTYESWYSNVLWWKEYGYLRKSTSSSWWCANSDPSNCPAFCN